MTAIFDVIGSARSTHCTLEMDTRETPQEHAVIAVRTARRRDTPSRLLPTMTSREWKDAGDPGTPSMQRNAKRRMLAATLIVEAGEYGGIDSRWATRFMGYPDGWLDL